MGVWVRIFRGTEPWTAVLIGGGDDGVSWCGMCFHRGIGSGGGGDWGDGSGGSVGVKSSKVTEVPGALVVVVMVMVIERVWCQYL